MRRLVQLGAVAALLGACQNDYPLEPTPCDDWCYEVERTMCWGMEPAECVAECEEWGRPKNPECVPLWDDLLDCYRQLPDGAACGVVWEMPCEAENMALGECQWAGDER